MTVCSQVFKFSLADDITQDHRLGRGVAVGVVDKDGQYLFKVEEPGGEEDNIFFCAGAVAG